MRVFVQAVGVMGAGVGFALALGLAGCKVPPAPKPINELSAQEIRGHTAFQVHCAVCHYDRQDAPLHGPSLSGLFKKPDLPSGAAATNERVTATVQHGRGMMPPMGGTMDPQELDDLLAYLHTL